MGTLNPVSNKVLHNILSFLSITFLFIINKTPKQTQP